MIPFLNSITCPASLQVRSKSKKVARFESWRAILMKYYACAGTIKQTAWHARYIDSDTARTDRRKRTRLLRTQNTGWFRSLPKYGVKLCDLKSLKCVIFAYIVILNDKDSIKILKS